MADAGAGGGGGGGAGSDGGSTVIEGNAHALALHGDGVLVAGGRSGRGLDFFLARFHKDGGLDSTFGEGGFVTVDFKGPDGGFVPLIDDSAFALKVTDEHITLVGGGRGPAVPVGGFAAARFTHEGVLDERFNGGGLRMTQVPVSGGGFATAAFYSVAMNDAGFVYAGGSVVTGASTGQDFAIVRITPAGTTDTTFADPPGGGVLQHYGSTVEAVRGLLVQGEKLVAAGGGDFLAVRYNDDGSRDLTFGDGGIAKHAGGEAFALAEGPGGALVLAGTRAVATDAGMESALKVVRYSADGVLDTAFGDSGAATAFVGLYAVKGVVVEPTGKIAVYGSHSLKPATARLLAEGTPDTAFGAGGLLVRDDASLPLFEQLHSGNHAVLEGNTLWTVDTGQGEGEAGVFTGTGVLLHSTPLP